MKRKLLLIVTIMLIFTACGKKEMVLVDENGESQTVKVEKYDGTNGISCYDYIVETMSKPQYWDGSVELPYASLSLKGIEDNPKQLADEVLVNGTAFTLTDEESATFSRGYQSTFSLNFSEGTAETVVHKDVVPYVDRNFPEGWFYDFNNNIWEARYIHNKTKNLLERVRPNVGFLPYADDDYHSSENNYGWVKDDVLEYERKFSEAGCPLLNQPKGTLTEYKEVLAHPENVTDDGKINGPWELEGFAWDYKDYDELYWSTDIESLLYLELPDSGKMTRVQKFKRDENGHVIKDSNGEFVYYDSSLNSNSMAFAAVVNPTTLSKLFEDSSYTEMEFRYPDGMRFFGSTGSLAAYYLTPALKTLYNENAVYMVDANKLTGDVMWYDVLTIDSNSYEAILNLSGEGIDLNESIFRILPLEDIEDKVSSMEKGAEELIGIYTYESFIREAYEAFEKEYPFANGYVFHWNLLYNLEDQIILGLR